MKQDRSLYKFFSFTFELCNEVFRMKQIFQSWNYENHLKYNFHWLYLIIHFTLLFREQRFYNFPLNYSKLHKRNQKCALWNNLTTKVKPGDKCAILGKIKRSNKWNEFLSIVPNKALFCFRWKAILLYMYLNRFIHFCFLSRILFSFGLFSEFP